MAPQDYPRFFSLGGGVAWSEHFAYQTDYTGRHYLRYVNENGNVVGIWNLFSVSPRFASGWTMFSMVVDIPGNFLKAYTNTSLTRNTAFPSPPKPINVSFFAPCDGGVNMTLDEIRLYNRILAEDEIKELYYNGLTNKFNITIGLLNFGYADLGNSFTAIVYLKNGTILQLPLILDNDLSKGYYLEKTLTIDGYYPSYGLIDKIMVCSNDCQGICSEIIVNNQC
jgi:hypothetical protein